MSRTTPYAGILSKPMKSRMDALWGVPVYFRGPPEERQRRVNEASLADAIDFGTCWLQLLRHYGIDMAEWDGPSALELALATQHVPAFQPLAVAQPRSGAPTMLDPIQTLRLLMDCDAREREIYAKTGKRPSRYALANWAAALPWCEEIGLSDETVRKLLRDLRTAGAAYRAGKPTEFQRQFYEVLVPVVFELAGTPIPLEEVG